MNGIFIDNCKRSTSSKSVLSMNPALVPLESFPLNCHFGVEVVEVATFCNIE
jgi:hypothetical protein